MGVVVWGGGWSADGCEGRGERVGAVSGVVCEVGE